MLESLAADNILSLAVRQPGMIVGPIAKFLGVIYNNVFNFIYNIGEANALGIAIIIFTILVKTVLIPLSYKQQKASFEMQKLQPEMDAIKKKYEKKKDMESQQKMALELQKLQKDNNVSMLGGCLPLLVQLPILYALFYIFQQAYIYIDVVGANYNHIAEIFLSIPETMRVDILTDPVLAHKLKVDVTSQSDLLILINQMNAVDWSALLANAGQYAQELTTALAEKSRLESFLGINLITNSGLKFPGILVPLCAGATTFLSSKILMKNSAAASGGDSQNPMNQAMQSMKIMNYTMPIMMGVMCITLPAGVGLYWTTSNIIQVLQTLGLNKYFRSKGAKEALQQ